MGQQEQALPNVYQRMRAVMKDVRGVGKSQYNSQAHYKYAGHEAVTEALRDAYVKHGIVRTADVIRSEREGGLLRLHVLVSWINVDNPEDRYSVTMVGESMSPTKAREPTSTQSGVALSYAVKNAEFKAFSLTGDDTPDAEKQDEERDRGQGERPRNGQRGSMEPPRDGEGLSESSFKALVRMYEMAANEAELDTARSAARKQIGVLSRVQKDELTKAYRAAQSRIKGAEKGAA